MSGKLEVRVCATWWSLEDPRECERNVGARERMNVNSAVDAREKGIFVGTSKRVDAVDFVYEEIPFSSYIFYTRNDV